MSRSLLVKAPLLVKIAMKGVGKRYLGVGVIAIIYSWWT